MLFCAVFYVPPEVPGVGCCNPKGQPCPIQAPYACCNAASVTVVGSNPPSYTYNKILCERTYSIVLNQKMTMGSQFVFTSALENRKIVKMSKHINDSKTCLLYYK
ncbi:7705_t:CDS:2, partial [Gigaspora margarita]